MVNNKESQLSSSYLARIMIILS